MVIGACSSSRPPVEIDPPGQLRLRVFDREIAGADSINAGWTRLLVEEDGEGHLVVGFRLGDESDQDLSRFLAALDTARASPEHATAIGGAEVGDTSEVIVALTPGRYAFACVRRDEGGKRHAALGELHVLTVEAAGVSTSLAPPAHTLDLPMNDFAYGGDSSWSAGVQLLRVTNQGLQDHQLRVARLFEGVTMRQWYEAPEDVRVDSTVAGLARISGNGTAFVPLKLTPGRYMIYCLIPDPKSDQPHVALGMMREIVVR